MSVLEMLSVVVDELVGTRGAVRNCRDEIHRREQDIAAVDRLGRRLPHREPDDGERAAVSA